MNLENFNVDQKKKFHQTRKLLKLVSQWTNRDYYYQVDNIFKKFSKAFSLKTLINHSEVYYEKEMSF